MNEQIFNQTLDLLEATKLNWSVSKEALFTKDGKASESFGIYRTDRDTYLGTVGNRYTPMQNSTLAETLVMASQDLNLKATRGGELDGGQKVHIQFELPDEIIGNSGVKRWLTALNSHDGSSSIGFGSTSQVVVCKNTFYKAYKGLEKFRHTESAENRVRLAAQDLKQALLQDELLMTTFKRMADMRADESLVERVIRKIFEVDIKQTKASDVSERKREQIQAFAKDVNIEVATHGETLWALFNGVTRYTNHTTKLRGDSERESYLMVGGGARINILGFNECMKWLEENSVKQYAMS